MRRFICLLLAALLLMPLAMSGVDTVHAEPIHMGDFNGMSEDVYNPGDVRTWNFTADSSGEYILDSYNGLTISLDGQSSLGASEGINTSRYRVYQLSGGSTYTIRATWPESNTSSNQAAFSLQKKQPLEYFTIGEASMSLGKGDTSSLAVDYAPYYYDASAIRWSSSDSSIVSVEGSYDTQGNIRGMNFGTATVTATLCDRQASCTIEVVKPQGEWDAYPLWPVGQSTMSASGTQQYRYEPVYTGWYVASVRSGSGYVEMRQTNWATDLPRKNAHLYDVSYDLYYLQAGETYVVTIVAGAGTTAMLEQAKAAKSITLYGPNETDGSRIIGAVGGNVSLYAKADPRYAYALAEGGFVYSSSDTSVATVENAGTPGDPGAEVFLVGPGSCTITVSVGNVKTYCQVTVGGQYEFKVGQTTTLKLDGAAYGVTGVFTPEKSGNYRFVMNGTGGTASIEGTNIGTYVHGSGTMSGWLEGGKTYLVKLSFGGTNHTVKVEYMDQTEPEMGDSPDGTEPTTQTQPGGTTEATEQTTVATQPTAESPEQTQPVVPEEPAVEVELDAQQQTLDRQQLEQLAQAGNTLELRREDVVVRLDSACLAAALNMGQGELTLSVQTAALEQLSDKQRTAVTDDFVQAVQIDFQCGDENIHHLGGRATILLPFTPEQGRSGSDYRVCWLSEDGQLEEMPTTYQDGALRFTTDHFSTFVVLRIQPQENNLLVPVLCVLAALVVIGGATVLLILRRKKQMNG